MFPEMSEDFLAREFAVMVPHLQELERHFFELVAYGNVPDVKEFLENNPKFNVNAVDFQEEWDDDVCRPSAPRLTEADTDNGLTPLLPPTRRSQYFLISWLFGTPGDLHGVTALHIAIRDRNMPMVEYLLSHPDIDPGDAHLHAIRENEIKIAMVILNKLKELSHGLEFAGVTQSTDFPDETTPLAVAAQYGHFEMINMLRNRHHGLAKPHLPSCICENCKSEREKYDDLTIEKMRLFIYKAVANPAFMCQTVDDPILEAFNLSNDLKKAGTFVREFYYEYKRLAEIFNLLDKLSESADEVEIILKRSTGFSHSYKFLYPRLLFALHNKERSFVAHPNIQQVITSKWIDGWYEWVSMNKWMKCLYVLMRIFVLPVILVVVLVAPNSKRSKFWQSPVNKFISSTASYLVFLLFVFLQSNMDKSEQLRGPPNNAYVWILIIYVMSFCWALFRICIIHGPKRFFAGPWYWFEMIMIFLFILTFLYWITAALDVRINGQLELERKYWNRYDPTLIAEGIYCLATIMAFLKLLYICQLDYHLGPLQLSLGQMIKDVRINEAVVSPGTCRLYQYYEDMVQIDDESKIKTQQVNSFVNFSATMKTLFWAIFCMSPIESADVIIENLPGESENETIINQHTFTEIIGYVAFAGFTFIGVIVILNMLIACMSNTMTKVTENVIVEWTFGRTETYVDCMLTTALPPPFNIIPTYVGVQPIVEYLKVWLKPTPEKRARWHPHYCFYIETLTEESNTDFDVVMGQLVQRYFRKKDKEAEENETEKLTREIIDFRDEMDHRTIFKINDPLLTRSAQNASTSNTGLACTVIQQSITQGDMKPSPGESLLRSPEFSTRKGKLTRDTIRLWYRKFNVGEREQSIVLPKNKTQETFLEEQIDHSSPMISPLKGKILFHKRNTQPTRFHFLNCTRCGTLQEQFAQ
ncbi:Short transient receptor potential channel 5 [Melipona quadrifasciata]|uniref:Short transient receptor potential channel 5 n=1 Tax=Melipona quadrifasciata TaxID=166423 RepID=A0A0M9AAR5_9HYME|nr:Short transient receptor potential channel 5 [Melipona quadrifasciata]